MRPSQRFPSYGACPPHSLPSPAAASLLAPPTASFSIPCRTLTRLRAMPLGLVALYLTSSSTPLIEGYHSRFVFDTPTRQAAAGTVDGSHGKRQLRLVLLVHVAVADQIIEAGF
eukprot:CAMPEP_0195588438 /NCGR_PEP_ID=MMETSP0814-20130614/32666_1 /TAXON_ID=97485 /ORGANISM="Prymnesium parvum, Strain Texoma1" /LENGTH=113 /DNA_ID=CAMNT_0040727387 /DNA_START=271 /DNA_END=612 /DNA_ORIENTATION=+